MKFTSNCCDLRSISLMYFLVCCFSIMTAMESYAYTNLNHPGGYMYNFYLPPAGTSGPRWPTWHPDGSTLAFAMQGSIWKIDIHETTAYELTTNSTYDSSPCWSPDGRFILYTAETFDQSIALKILNVKTGESSTIWDDGFVYLDPVWSPDGSHIAYVSSKPNGYYNIFTMPMKDGKSAGPPQALTADNAYSRGRLYFGRWDMHMQPTWSPDGQEIIFLSNRNVPLGSGVLWRMSSQPTKDWNAAKILDEESLYRTRPDWSPDGSRIVYSSYVGGEFNHLFLLPAEGGLRHKITFGDWDDFHPRWSPDGRRIAFITNRNTFPEINILQVFGGRISPVPIAKKVWKKPVGKLRVIVMDAETWKPTPSRIYLTASDGKIYMPDRTYHRIGHAQEHLYHAPGTFELDVPVGPLSVEAMKGFEYIPVAENVTIRRNEMTEVILKLERLSNLNEEGWFSGSTHTHMNYGGDLHNTPEYMQFMAEAEDLNVTNSLIANKDNRMLDMNHFTGKPHPLSTNKRVLFFSQEYRPPHYGHTAFLGLKDHVILPNASSYEGSPIASPYPSNTEMFRLAKAQGAFCTYVHPYTTELDPLEDGGNGLLGGAKAFPIDAALGTVDALEVMSKANKGGYIVWHHLLNNGFRIIPVAGEDSITNLYRIVVLGQQRTFVYLGDAPLNWENWLEGLYTGRIFITNGPLLDFTVNGVLPGGQIQLPASGGEVTLRGEVQCIAPMTDVKIYHNGEIFQHIPLTQNGQYAQFEKTVRVKKSGWFTLMAEGEGRTHPIGDNYPKASTNAVRVFVGKQLIRSKKSADYFIRWIDRLKTMTAALHGWRTAEEKQIVFDLYDKARAVYQQRKKEAE